MNSGHIGSLQRTAALRANHVFVVGDHSNFLATVELLEFCYGTFE